MQVLIVEDEKLASQRLTDLIRDIDSTVQILAVLESIRATVMWLKNNPLPEVIFMDIHLADGISFQIFEKVRVNVPVIFTTAYDEYALRAFKVNSIDYLLKPIGKEELCAAIDKLLRLQNVAPVANYPQIMKQMMDLMQSPYRKRFVIRIGEHIKSICTEDVAFCYSNEKASYLRTSSGRDLPLECSLEQLEDELDPKKFFRVSRKYLVAMAFVTDIIAYSGSRLKLVIEGSKDTEILVSREKVTEFKKWLEG